MIPVCALKRGECEDVKVVRPLTISDGVPVRALLLEREADSRTRYLRTHDGVANGLEALRRQTFAGNEAGEEIGAAAVLVAEDVLFPTHHSSVVAELLAIVAWEMVKPEILIRLCEPLRREALCVRLVLSIDCSCAPAAVDELPLPAVDFGGIPGVSGFVSWQRFSGLELGVAVSFAMATNNHSFEADFHRHGGE